MTEPQAGIGRFQPILLGAGVLGLVASAIGFVVDREQFFRSWLPSYLFWFSIVAGSLAVLMLQYVTGGEWGLLIRRPLGAAARTMWVMLIAFIPVALGMKVLYPWANSAWAGYHEVQHLKGAYLNREFFLIRVAIYFLFFLGWAWRIRVLSLRFYESRSPYIELSRSKWAASGLVIVVLMLTFVSTDWMMSTEPMWYSTMYGITFLVGCALSAFAFVTFFLTRLAATGAMRQVLRPSHLRDLGNLMLAFVMFYAYTSFSEYLLIWYANIHEEIPHFLVRQQGAWAFIALALILFHFFLPFFMLLMRQIKDRPETIGVVTVIIIVMRYVAIYWLVAPSWYGAHFAYSWMDLASLVGIGGIWLWAFIGQLKGQTIIPIHETWVEEAIREGAIKVNA